MIRLWIKPLVVKVFVGISKLKKTNQHTLQNARTFSQVINSASGPHMHYVKTHRIIDHYLLCFRFMIPSLNALSSSWLHRFSWATLQGLGSNSSAARGATHIVFELELPQGLLPSIWGHSWHSWRAKAEIALQLKQLAEAYSARGDRWRSWQLAKAWLGFRGLRRSSL